MDPLLPEDPREVGGFVLTHRLGQGGMGTVYLGRSPGGRRVAVKVINSELRHDPACRRRFAHEVEAVRQVGGFFTAAVLDANPDAPMPWMASAYIPGRSLREVIEQHGPLSAVEVRRLGAGLAEGLAAIHERGLVHRDLKPENVILTEDGPRVIDFGISRAVDRTRHTAAGNAIGTPAYMSPEQAAARPEIGPASDVFSLGSLLAYAATGRAPFEGGGTDLVLHRVMTAEPSLDGLDDGPLLAVVRGCLAKGPDDRPDMAEVLGTITGLVQETDWESGGSASAHPARDVHTRPERQQFGPPSPRHSPRFLGRLPAETTSFIGRQRELTEIGRMFERCRLVTLLGPGGVGKTRLAVRAASHLASSFEHGVCFVDLSGLRDPSLLAQAVGDAFGLPAQAPDTVLNALVHHLYGRRVLLVLDTCEHVIDGCVTLAQTLLQNAPGLQIMATSRQPLDISSEYTLMVRPLAVPDLAVGKPNQAGLPRETHLLSSETCDSMRLFAERASAVVSGWTLTAVNFPLVAMLCNRLDGIPLAIELTAVQLRALSIEQVAARLGQRTLGLRGGRSGMPRHQTLRAAIDWSHELCEPGERLLWARLSVFAGDFDLEDAEQICSDGELPEEEIVKLLAGLVAQSIVLRVDSDGDARYRMLDSLREYGAERLVELGEAEAMRARVFERFRSVLRQAETELGTSAQARWLEWFRLRLADLRVAMEYVLRTADAEELDRAILGYGRILVLLGHVGEARYWGDRVLEAIDVADLPSHVAVEGLALQGLLALLQEDLASGRELLKQAEQLAGTTGNDVRGLAYVREVQGITAVHTNQVDEAIDLLHDAYDLHRMAGHEDILVPIIGLFLAATCTLAFRLEEAERYASEVISTAEAAGEQWCRSYALCLRGLAVALDGDGRRGLADLRAALIIKRDMDDRLGLALVFDLIGFVLLGLGDAPTAARLAGAADAALNFTRLPLFGLRHRDLRLLCAQQAEKIMGEKLFRAAYSQGADLPLEITISTALGEPVAPPPAGPEPGSASH